MTIIVFAACDSVSSALNPLVVFLSIQKTLLSYIALVFFFYLLMLVGLALWIGAIYFTGSSIIGLCIGFYFLMVAFHTLGIFYLQCQLRLGWFVK
jgi:hypothetical protein